MFFVLPHRPAAWLVPTERLETLGAVVLWAGAAATGGIVSFVLHPLALRALGSPVHTHTREDEWSTRSGTRPTKPRGYSR